MKNTAYPQVKDSDEQELNLKQIFEQYAFYWKWFVISIIACLFVAFVYLRYAQKVYNTSAKILLQDEKQASGDMAGLAELATMTGMGGSSAAFVNDQMEILRSRRLMRKVVDTNRLYLSYFLKGSIKSAEVMEAQSPLKVVIVEPDHPALDSSAYVFTVSKKEETYILKDEDQGARIVQLGEKIDTQIGQIMIFPQERNNNWEGDLQINYIPPVFMVDALRDAIEITPNKEPQSFLVNFSLDYPLIPK